jgi:hypothetical protein
MVTDFSLALSMSQKLTEIPKLYSFFTKNFKISNFVVFFSLVSVLLYVQVAGAF